MANPPTRLCTKAVFPATRPLKTATLSSPVTHLSIENPNNQNKGNDVSPTKHDHLQLEDSEPPPKRPPCSIGCEIALHRQSPHDRWPGGSRPRMRVKLPPEIAIDPEVDLYTGRDGY